MRYTVKDGDEIVISGISGRYPESDNIQEFSENLYNGKDMVTIDDRRWPRKLTLFDVGIGKLKQLNKFDAKFFKVNNFDANHMDAQIRMMLELTYEAIWDSGIDPNSICGSNTGVFIGNCFDDYTMAYSSKGESPAYRQAIASMVSNKFGFTGPAMVVDTACASSFSALNEAMLYMRTKQCDSAIIAGINICLNPMIQHQFHQMKMLSKTGHCRCLDAGANGYAKAETCVVIYVQRKSVAKRIYAEILNTYSNNDGYEEQGITYPTWKTQSICMQKAYDDCGVDPNQLDYVEAHCTGTLVGDPQEMKAICHVMCKNRTADRPLMIGAIKSSVGHSEGASGLAAVSKTILVFENGLIPRNLNYEKPNETIPQLMNGIIVPVIENTPFNGDIIGLNNFGFGGSNVVVILKSPKIKAKQNNNKIIETIPRLVLMCGRNEESIQYFFENLMKNKKYLTRDSLALINEISKTNPFGSDFGFKGMNSRGFTIIENENQSSYKKTKLEVNKVGKSKRQLWYVCSGLGTQWSAMAKNLLKLEVFAKSIMKSCKTLNSHTNGYFEKLLMNENQNQKTSDSSLNCFVELTAIQIALIDLLNDLDIKPDGIIGHSIGELVCAYADGCLTAEETIEIAYWRARIVEECVPKNGAMAEIGLGFNAIKNMCPNGVNIGCDDSIDSVTISGEKSVIQKFVAELKSKDISTTFVHCFETALHSQYMETISTKLLNKLNSIITSKRKISSKWLSTTYSTNKSNNYLTAQYIVDNLLFPVQLNNALKQIPNNAIVIEISTHHLLQSILKQGLSENIGYISLMSRNSDNMKHILSSIGKLYSYGLNPRIENLYPKVNYPVSTGTGILSPLIKWNHNKDFITPKYPDFFNPSHRHSRSFEINLMDKSDAYLTGHVIDGKNIFPFVGYLFFAWTHMSGYYGMTWKEMPVEFLDITIHRATFIDKKGANLMKSDFDALTNRFIITESNTIVVSGRMSPMAKGSKLKYQNLIEENEFDFSENSENIVMNKKDIYKELRLRGFDHNQEFQGLSRFYMKNENTNAEIEWSDNFVTFSDSMLQMALFNKDFRGLFVPVRIEEIRCDPTIILAEAQKYQQLLELEKSDKNQVKNDEKIVKKDVYIEGVKVEEEIQEEERESNPLKQIEVKKTSIMNALFDNELEIGVCKGFEYRAIRIQIIERNVRTQKPILEKYSFTPFINSVTNNKYSHKYSNECDRIAIDIVRNHNLKINFKDLKTIKMDYKESIESQFNQREYETHINQENMQILNYLKNVNEKFGNKDSKELNKYVLNLENDILFESFNNSKFIEPLMMTAFENIIKSKLKIAEINESSVPIYSQVEKVFDINDFERNLDYTLYHPKPNDLGKESLKNINIKTLDTEKVTEKYINEEIDIIILKDSSVSQFSTKPTINLESILKNAYNMVRINGFLLIICKDSLTYAESVVCKLLDIEHFENRKQKLTEIAERIGFLFISENKDLFYANALLFRKINPDISVGKQIFIHLTDDFDSWISKLQTELNSIDEKPEDQNIWLIGNDKPTNGIMGFFNCLRKEPKGDRLRVIFNFNQMRNPLLNDLSDRNKILSSIISKDLKTNVFKDVMLGNFQMKCIEDLSETKLSKHCYLNVSTKGDLSSFKWFEAYHKHWPIGRKDKQILVNIYYSALNFKDVMFASGRIAVGALPGEIAQQDCVLGIEFSGRDENGNRVMGAIYARALATTCIVEPQEFLWPVPEHWTLEEAASVPIVYATAYYALVVRGKLKRGETVLIHSGSGGVGQAAINICLQYNCEIYVTVGSDEKKESMKKLFPSLTDRHFSSSRNLSFKNHVMNETNGMGVNLVLNSLSDDKLKASVECLAPNGRFLEIGKYDSSVNNSLELTELIHNKSFHGIHLDTLFDKSFKMPNGLKRDISKIWDLVREGINNGTVRPLNRTIFANNECEKAFRYMASGKHTGKVIIRIREEEKGNIPIQKTLMIAAIPKTVFHANKSYIVTGGLGGMGLELINWMIERGAKNFVITSRTGPKEPYQFSRLKYFEKWGAKVVISTQNISVMSGAENLVKIATDMGPLGGIFHLAMVMSDALFSNQNVDTFKTSCGPKSDALTNLDIITRRDCPELDYFVAYSSASSSRGNAGQTNYGWSNSVMDRICDLRRMDGLHALALHWGVIGDVGYVVETFGDKSNLIFGGTVPQRMPSVLSTLDHFLQTELSIGSSFVKSDAKLGSKSVDKDLLKRVGHIIGVEEIERLDPNTKLLKLGIDSLMGVEIRNIIERDFECVLSAEEMRDLTIGGLKKIESGEKSSADILEILATNETRIRIPSEDISRLNNETEGRTAFFIPGFDGAQEPIESVAKLLKRPLYALNWTPKCLVIENLEKLADYYIELIDKNFPQLDKHYDLIAFSFGTYVGYEMSIRLQTKFRRLPKLIFLDYSPMENQFTYESIGKHFNFEVDLQDMNSLEIYIYTTFLASYISFDLKNLYNKLKTIETNERKSKAVKMFIEMSGKQYDIEIVDFLCQAFYSKSMMGFKYTFNGIKYEGMAQLYRAKDSILKFSIEDKHVDDYGINQLLTNECEVLAFDGRHETFLSKNAEEISLKMNQFLK